VEEGNLILIPHYLKLKLHDFRRNTLIGEDKEAGLFYKIEIETSPKKNNDIKAEYKIIKHLNRAGCKSTPIAYDIGTMSKEEVVNLTEVEEEKEYIKNLDKEKFNFIIQEYIPHEESYALPDILFSLIEQKNLGIYHGDIKPKNIRFDPLRNICVLIDYDQSIFLTEAEKNTDINSFLSFCDAYDKEKYQQGLWLRHFKEFGNEDIPQYLNSAGALNLAETAVYKKQETTNTDAGIYHTLSYKDIFAQGARDISERKKILDKLEFKDGEKVLDVGCNSGLLSVYLHSRGCKVSGVDIDPFIVIGAKMISNIIGAKGIDFFRLNLDEAEELPRYDTVMLFSVLHHTKDPKANAKKIAKKCNRIIIESRLYESGKEMLNNEWQNTSHWNFKNTEDLICYYENIFPGFKLRNNLGKVDKGRLLLEFYK
jgi:2-polyprenyl-3-methyl-5-hydroxy-6-metoxy-1,4-benzoquinol methylase